MEIKEVKLTPKRIKFLETFVHLYDSDTLKEMFFAQLIQIEKLEKIRSNTSMLVWWLVAIPIIIAILMFFGFIGTSILI